MPTATFTTDGSPRPRLRNSHQSARQSILGIAVVRGGVVREVHNWMIKPRYWPNFSPWNVMVHGIKPEDVAGAPRWDGIWSEVSEILHGQTVVAHNAAFDMSVLRSPMACRTRPVDQAAAN